MPPLPVTVIKRNPAGKETWRYPGIILQRSATTILLEARFNRPDLPFHGILIKQGDRFVERFYTDRWYNIFEIHDREDDSAKGWYCNIGMPAVIEETTTSVESSSPGVVVSYVDLALDVLVYPDGQQLVLDEDEFAAQDLPREVRAKALAALAELQANFHTLRG
jgi:hypothetical protein